MNEEILQLLQIADHLPDHPNLSNIRGTVIARLAEINAELGPKVVEPEEEDGSETVSNARRA